MIKLQFNQKKINQIHLLDALIISPYNHVNKRNFLNP